MADIMSPIDAGIDWCRSQPAVCVHVCVCMCVVCVHARARACVRVHGVRMRVCMYSCVLILSHCE